jgi:hypothetical protein
MTNQQAQQEPEYHIYYLRCQIEGNHSKKGHPFGCVCISPLPGDKVFRCIAICSEEEQFSYEEARKRVLRRYNNPHDESLFATYNRKNYRGTPVVSRRSIGIGTPTDFEREILATRA